MTSELSIKLQRIGAPGGGDDVFKWHLDGATFDPVTGLTRIWGWVIPSQATSPVHVAVRQDGCLRSFLPNQPRADVVDKVKGAGGARHPDSWCGFRIELPSAGPVEFGFERDGRTHWVYRLDPAGATAVAGRAGGATEAADAERIRQLVGNRYGPGQAVLVDSREPMGVASGRVRILQFDVDGGHGPDRVRVVHKRGVSRHEQAIARRLLTPDGAVEAGSFVPVIGFGDEDNDSRWILSEYCIPQADMYLDPSEHVESLVRAVCAVNRSFPDLATEVERGAVMGRFTSALTLTAAADADNRAAATPSLRKAIEVLQGARIVASHNDFYWNNLSLQPAVDGSPRVRMFDLELVGANLLGAEFHQFARMAMEHERFREPFEALVGRYAELVHSDVQGVRIAALAFALVRSVLRLPGYRTRPVATDGTRPRCAEPDAYRGLGEWLSEALETRTR